MPEDNIPDAPEVKTEYQRDLWRELINRLVAEGSDEIEAMQAFDEGDTVDTPDGLGVVSEIRTEAFDGPDDSEVSASDDSPAYVVALASEDMTVGVYTASELDATEFPDVDVENPEGDLEAMRDVAHATQTEALQDGFFEWPQSWVDSPQPARLIALKAWAGMGGRFTGCTREMRGEIASPDRFCADFKDRILGWEGWRQ